MHYRATLRTLPLALLALSLGGAALAQDKPLPVRSAKVGTLEEAAKQKEIAEEIAGTPDEELPNEGPKPPAFPLRARPMVNVKVALPATFEPGEEFVGFHNRLTGSSFLIHDTDRRGLPQAIEMFTDLKLLKRQSRTLLSQRKVRYAGYAGLRVELEQKVDYHPEVRRIECLTFGDDEGVCTVQASWVVGRGAGEVEALRAALESVVWDRPAKVDPFEGLTWVLDHARGPRFRLMIFTHNGRVEYENTGRPILVAQRTPIAIGKEEREAIALARLRGIPGLEDVEIDRQQVLSVNGLPAIEILAHGVEAGTKPAQSGDAKQGEAKPKGGERTPPVDEPPGDGDKQERDLSAGSQDEGPIGEDEDILGGLPAFEEDEGPRMLSIYQLVVFGPEEHWLITGRIWQRIGRNWMLEFENFGRFFLLLPPPGESAHAKPAESGRLERPASPLPKGRHRNEDVEKGEPAKKDVEKKPVDEPVEKPVDEPVEEPPGRGHE